MHTLETSQIVFHCNNGLKESCSLGIFHSCIHLLLVEAERFDILWDPIHPICTNDTKTLITISINNRIHNKVFFHRCRWCLIKYLPLARHTYTDNFYKITLKYVDFLGTCS